MNARGRRPAERLLALPGPLLDLMMLTLHLRTLQSTLLIERVELVTQANKTNNFEAKYHIH